MYTVIREGNVILEKFFLYYNDELIEEYADINRVAYLIGANFKF